MKKLLMIPFTLVLAMFLGACNADNAAQDDTNDNTDIIDEDVNDAETNGAEDTNGLGTQDNNGLEDTNEMDGTTNGNGNNNDLMETEGNEATDGTVDRNANTIMETEGNTNGTNGTGAGTETGAGAGINGGTTDNGLNSEMEHQNEVPETADEES